MNDIDRVFDALFRNTIGFDHLSNYTQRNTSFPPYDVVREDDNNYRLQVALAGYGPEDVEITQEDRKLVIRSVDTDTPDVEKYLHRGIAKRKFSFALLLDEHIEVRGAEFLNGLLLVKLERELPERLQPRRISVSYSSPPALEHKNE